jgi:molybdopterin-guanine dinucleotide biosynthesis protein A
MGMPKALVEVAGRPMVSRIVSTVGSAGLEPVVVAKPDSPLPRLDCRLLA